MTTRTITVKMTMSMTGVPEGEAPFHNDVAEFTMPMEMGADIWNICAILLEGYMANLNTVIDGITVSEVTEQQVDRGTVELRTPQ